MWTTRCPRCQRIGLVRFETVLRAGDAYRRYACGGCHHTWNVSEFQDVPAQEPKRSDKLDRPRR